VVVAGERLPTSELLSALGAPIRKKFSLQFARTDRFGQKDLFRAKMESGVDTHVWMDTTTSGVVRLYFSNREGTRYLMRTLELSDPMNEMDREALAQVLESSLLALQQGTAGLTRQQAESLVHPPSIPVPQPTEPSPVRAPAPPPAPSWRSQSHGWLPETAPFYRLAAHSDEVFVVHGPGVRLGTDWLGAVRQLGVAISAQYQLPQRHEDQRLRLTLQTLALRLVVRTVETGFVPRSGLMATFGIGLDTVWFSTKALDEQMFEAAPSRTSLLPLMVAGLGWQLRVNSRARLELAVGLELDLTSVHYDIAHRDRAERFVTRWPARPTVSVGVEFW
jgi:hypothetical protein